MPKRMIRDILADRPLITVSKEMTVRAACCLMAEKRIGALLVLEGLKTVGIFTERDALNKVLATTLDPDKTLVAQVMVADPLCIHDDKPLAHALHMMSEGGFRHMPVIDAEGRAIGMVSARDALGQEMVELEQDMKRMAALESVIAY